LNRQHLFYRFHSVPLIFSEIIRKRRQHEYALQRRNKRVLDYDAYIATELAILKLIRIRRQVSILKQDEQRSCLTDRAVQLCQTVLSGGIPAALDLWDSWFTGSEQGMVQRDRFRYLDPKMPEAVGLLRTRLLLHSLQSSWSKIDLPDEQVIMKQPLKSHSENEELQQRTRAWLDTLATSNWGQQSAANSGPKNKSDHKADDRRFIDKIEKSIISRLVRLHRQLCYRFQSRIDVWIRFVEMCKILGRHMSVVRLWNRILQVHGRTDPRLWAAAASYHLHENAKAKIRSSLRKMSGETDKLTEQQKKLRRELKALTRFVEEKNKKTVASIVEELRQNTEKLNQASDELARDRRLLWDRIYLDAIREARRLLTEGLSLNPDCKLLQLELVKLEAAAADFFSTRIADRYDSVKEDGEPATESMDVSGDPVPAVVKSKKRKKHVAKIVEDDNTQFMAHVTEDVSFVASGKALKLVMESLLDQSPDDVKTLESLQLVASTVPHLVEDSLVVKLNEMLEKLKTEPSQSHPPTEKVIFCYFSTFE
ncbi:hypothetical protein AHF37_09828, partial [Paragonimus kellicotti]